MCLNVIRKVSVEKASSGANNLQRKLAETGSAVAGSPLQREIENAGASKLDSLITQVTALNTKANANKLVSHLRLLSHRKLISPTKRDKHPSKHTRCLSTPLSQATPVPETTNNIIMVKPIALVKLNLKCTINFNEIFELLDIIEV